MKFQAAVVNVHDITYAIVSVKEYVIDSKFTASRVIKVFEPLFPGLPIILVSINFHGLPAYFGNEDVLKVAMNVPVQDIPWQEYTVEYQDNQPFATQE
ncbi:hypothetical protein [Acetonema longum]|uniref:Uncharacterized protein n=1 Tax=Acetonema longum DSM 6540 TaxID=1009370 RepID=F7NKJ2_9FIRM|nr:hypothetical protein [Acetonema longum]EGO63444.1 hypothetical protein ALO_13030 [Acetonema longum DSM 6540]